MFRVLKSGKRKKKSWKRMVTKVTFVGQGFTRKPPKYERFIRPSGEPSLVTCDSFCQCKLRSSCMRNMLDRHWVNRCGQDVVHSCDARASIEFTTC